MKTLGASDLSCLKISSMFSKTKFKKGQIFVRSEKVMYGIKVVPEKNFKKARKILRCALSFFNKFFGSRTVH